MTSELNGDGRRRRSHQRSKSSIGDYISPLLLDPISNVEQMKESSESGKKEANRNWFKTKQPSTRLPDFASDLEVDKEKPSQQDRVVQGLYRDDDGGPSPKTLTTSHSASRDSLKEFAKDFVAQMKVGNPDKARVMESQMRQFLRLPSSSSPMVPLKLVVEAYIAHQFFSNFENASFGIPHAGEKPWEVQDHMRRCFEQFRKCKTKSQTVSMLLETHSTESSGLSFLSQFCMQKFRTIVPTATFFGGDSHHHLELGKGHHPDTPFNRSFLSAAVSVWLLQRLAFSFEQKIVPIFPTGGDAFQRHFMTSVVPGIGDVEGEENDGNLEIAFTVFPGFRVSESVLLSSVYIVDTPTALPEMEIPSPNPAEPPVEASPQTPNDGKLAQLPEGLVYTYETPTVLLPKMDTRTSTPVSELPVETSHISLKDKENGLLKKIRSRFHRKKTLGKGTHVTEKTSVVTSSPPPKEEQVSYLGEASPRSQEALSAPSIGKVAVTSEDSTPSRGEAAPLELEPPQPTDYQAKPPISTPSVTNRASELSSPKSQPQNLEIADSLVPAYAIATNNDGPLYVPRSRKSGQPPALTPQLSSVD